MSPVSARPSLTLLPNRPLSLVAPVLTKTLTELGLASLQILQIVLASLLLIPRPSKVIKAATVVFPNVISPLLPLLTKLQTVLKTKITTPLFLVEILFNADALTFLTLQQSTSQDSATAQTNQPTKLELLTPHHAHVESQASTLTASKTTVTVAAALHPRTTLREAQA
jgi:hypothetical protein